MKFNYEDLQQLLIQSLPEELWNPDDFVNSAMALDCITTVPEDFFQEMTDLVSFLWKVGFLGLKKIYGVLYVYSF